MKKWISLIVVVALTCMMFESCRKRYIPRPYGYYRITLPDTSYKSYRSDDLPYSFDLSEHAIVSRRTSAEELYWIDIEYPTLHAKISCTYKPVTQDNFSILSEEAQKFVFKHATKASAIPEQYFENSEQHVYGIFYTLKGSTASPYQFVLTDSTHHFFRAALYFNNLPNQDSIAPVAEYMQHDLRRIIESFQWTK